MPSVASLVYSLVNVENVHGDGYLVSPVENSESERYGYFPSPRIFKVVPRGAAVELC